MLLSFHHSLLHWFSSPLAFVSPHSLVPSFPLPYPSQSTSQGSQPSPQPGISYHVHSSLHPLPPPRTSRFYSSPALLLLPSCPKLIKRVQIRKLMGPTSLTPPLVLTVLLTQLALAILLRNTHPFSWRFIATAYILGGTLNQNTFLAIHEITHNLAFKSIRANKCLAIIANLAISVPYAMAFKGYHIEHHKFLGEDGIDTDLPSRIEAVVLNNVAGKTFFA